MLTQTDKKLFGLTTVAFFIAGCFYKAYSMYQDGEKTALRSSILVDGV